MTKNNKSRNGHVSKTTNTTSKTSSNKKVRGDVNNKTGAADLGGKELKLKQRLSQPSLKPEPVHSKEVTQFLFILFTLQRERERERILIRKFHFDFSIQTKLMAARKGGAQANGNSTHLQVSDDGRMRDENKERDCIVLWRKPVTTIHYFLVELILDIKEYTIK